MSAVAIAVGTDGIVVASDGVCYEYETGDVKGYRSKVILMPEYSAFIAATGLGNFGVSLRWALDQTVNCFDDIVDQFEDVARRVHRDLCRRGLFHWDTGRGTEACAVIGGWSDARQKYEAWRLVSYDKESSRTDVGTGEKIDVTLKPFHKEELPLAIWCSHLPQDMASFGVDPIPPKMATIDVLARLICASRATSGPAVYEEDGRHFNAGGFLQLATIQRDDIRSWIAHRWPEDEIGKPIDPTKGERMPGWLEAA